MSGANLLIINSLQGGGGHRLGRIFSCFENVYWYAHVNNGMHPWEFAQNDKIKEAQFSKMHYDRLLPDGTMVPLIGSRIEKYWDNEDWYHNWEKIISTLTLPSQYITYVVHDSPQYLRRLFPKSFIVNLISDPVVATHHHLRTSGNFRIDFKHKGQRPDYDSEWVMAQKKLLQINPDATEKDLWEYRYDMNYEAGMLELNEYYNSINISEKKYSDITLYHETLDPLKYENQLGKLNVNYERLMRPK